MRTMALAGLSLVLVACGGSDVSDKLAAACMKDGSMNATQCRCVAERAEKDLSKDAQQLVVAEMEENRAQVDELSKKMSMQDAASVGTFLMNAMSQCTVGTANE